MPISPNAPSAEAIRRKLRAIAAVLLDPAATDNERSNAEALKLRLEKRLGSEAAPEAAWTNILFRLGRGVKNIKQSTASRPAPKGRLDRRCLPAWQDVPQRPQEIAPGATERGPGKLSPMAPATAESSCGWARKTLSTSEMAGPGAPPQGPAGLKRRFLQDESRSAGAGFGVAIADTNMSRTAASGAVLASARAMTMACRRGCGCEQRRLQTADQSVQQQVGEWPRDRVNHGPNLVVRAAQGCRCGPRRKITETAAIRCLSH